jgi:DtxR family transcriptional regulator, Mn-dependent transcriptional regulator
MKSFREENYLKAIYQITNSRPALLATITELANVLEVKPPSVLEKINLLVKKGLITYNKKEGAKLSKVGKDQALNIIRRHRIWETYLYKQLRFSWSEIHDIAEQLEHVHSEKLIDRIYDILGKPQFDPHGDPIPSKTGVIPKLDRRPLSKSVKGCKCVILGVGVHTDEFLNHLTHLKITLGEKVQVENVMAFDSSVMIKLKDKTVLLLSSGISDNLYVRCTKDECACHEL